MATLCHSRFDSRMWRLEEQKNRYGGCLYIRDEGGNYDCFYRGCGQKMTEDFGGHIESHENRNDEVDDEYRKNMLAKYRNRPEVASASSLRVKSSLRRSKEAEISLQKCEGILEILCALCDSVPLTITPAQEPAICKCREGSSWTLSNLVFEPLRARGWSLVSTKQALDLGAVYRKLKLIGEAGYKDAEDFAMDVRHALNYMRMAAGNATIFAALPGREFQSHLQRLATEFAFQMEYERLNQRFDNAEKKMEATYGTMELSYSSLIEILGSLLSSPHSSVLEVPDTSSYYSAYLSEFSTHHYRGITPINSVLEVNERLRSGELCGAPFFLFSRTLRSYLHYILLWNEHQNDAYVHTDKLAHFLESQLEKAAQKAFMDSHRDFRYSARDQHSQLLIWDPAVKQYYLEYFVSPTTEWQTAKVEREKVESMRKAEAGDWSPELGPSNRAKQISEVLQMEVFIKGGISRFATPPAPEPAASFVSPATASTLLSASPAHAGPHHPDPNWNTAPQMHSQFSGAPSPNHQRTMPGAISMHHMAAPSPSHTSHTSSHAHSHPSTHTMSAPTPTRVAPSPSLGLPMVASSGRLSPSMAPNMPRPSMPSYAPIVGSPSIPSMPKYSMGGPSMAPSPQNSFGPGTMPPRGPSPAPTAGPMPNMPSYAPNLYYNQGYPS